MQREKERKNKYGKVQETNEREVKDEWEEEK